MNRILLVGADGQVGWELQRTLLTLGDVIAVGRNTSQSALRVDLAAPDTIQQVVRELKPSLIVNAAAYTAVDKAEQEVELAEKVNAVAPGILAEEAKRLGAAIVHYSTDYVFNGSSDIPYTEQDQPDPLNTYGRTKLIGEQAIQAVGLPHLILRTSWVYGLRGRNFLLTMLKLAQEREELRIVSDQIGAPTWSRTIAEATAQVLASSMRDPERFWAEQAGLYHLTAVGRTSWHGFAEAIFQLQRLKTLNLKALVAIPSEQYPTPAKRPAYSQLDTSKLSETFGLKLPEWRRALELALDISSNSVE
ncbi:dTDP-4-dehydrorhamnose reductase [Leptolyngbya sp. FACHB-261]|uniref:dTDP-4-dehydrorhamnose reductase n=1 Tax=Leptolyngbya sp. FACHB-261 TaxID=2692806 RepID=UPI00168860D5|nr:dTDP-4-dehydrorhamnose reductase [Leptolyngbya sp. FACHB-261]MBD2102439.1 dTDP-4-dehydrorhamnose reductase [Leptolyngbya sp. FACHB-261]